jgi:hypothetical protein
MHQNQLQSQHPIEWRGCSNDNVNTPTKLILCPYFIYLSKDNSHQNRVVKIGLRGHMNAIPCLGNISVQQGIAYSLPGTWVILA